MQQRLRGEGGPSRYPNFKRHEVELIRSKPRFLIVRRARREEGQALVEFALVLPVLLIILLGIMQFGILFQNYLTLTDAVRSGSRALAIGRGSLDPCAAALTATQTAGGTLSLSGRVTTNIVADNPLGTTCGTPGDLIEGQQATVYAVYPCNVNILGIVLLGGNCLKAQATERIE